MKRDFDVVLGLGLLALQRNDRQGFLKTISTLREDIVRGFTPAYTASTKLCHEQLLRLHALYELETITDPVEASTDQKEKVVEVLDSRLGTLGAFTTDKQLLLALRRAAMQLSEYALRSFRADFALINGQE